MKDLAALVAHHPNLSEASSAAYALGLLPLLYPRSGRGQREEEFTAISDEAIAFLHALQIDARLESYGLDLGRFEKDLLKKPSTGQESHPLISVPSTASVDWTTGSFLIRPQTFIVAYEHGAPVFLTREPHAHAVTKLSLHQLRFLHRTWSTWPAILPSMLLTVLWHRPLKE
ncbi:hypothetical protein [Oleiharenicola lentus]|uniref:hypothetical protein n=1 Tax=Oleiharenicola lentus TaxID=2508720 RepID=UPI003F6782B1